jgi:flagellin
VRNSNDAISLIQTAEGSTEQITNMLQRMRELAVQSSNDTNNDKDRGFLNGEFQQLKSEINRIGQNTQWNGANILDGTGGNSVDGKFSFQIGANSQQTISIELPNMQTSVSSGLTLPDAGVTAGVATMNFTAYDASTTPSDYVGVTVQATVAGKAVQYQITQTDVDNAGTTNLSDAIAGGIETKLKAAFGSTGSYVVTHNASAGTLTVDPDTTNTGLAALTDGATGTAKATEIEGNLSSIGHSDVTSASTAYDALQSIDSALQTVNAKRSNMGALISRLQFASDNLSNVAAKATESRSRIEDTDYSIATTELAKRNIIQQAAQAMLAQANQAPQMVLQLLK